MRSTLMKFPLQKFLILAAAALLWTACQKPPQTEIDQARQTLTEAETAQAATYAGPELESAKQAQRALDEEVQAQNDKFALFRSYDHAKELAAQAQTAAENARQAAADNKAKARQDAEAASAAVTASLDEAQQLLTSLGECPRQPKGFQADLEALQAKLDGLKAEAQGISDAITSEDYAGANTQAQSLQDQTQLLITDLNGAKEKIGC